MNVIIVLRPGASVPDALAGGALGGLLGVPTIGLLGGFRLDPEFAPLVLPGQVPARTPAAQVDPGLLAAVVVRGEIPDGDEGCLATLHGLPGVIGVFSDPALVETLICPGSPAQGTERDVSNLLFTAPMHAAGMDGTGVRLAVVDPDGINTAYLSQRGRPQTVVAAWSSKPANVKTGPGAHPVGHGTAMAYDAAIAAPRTVLLDHRISSLSDALRAYNILFQMMLTDATARLVANNSWGTIPSQDLPPGHPENYSDNPLHPFNWMVTMLEAAGADLVFGAGNCGRDCPIGSCHSSNPISGAKSHPAVLTVAGVDTTKARVGSSSQGPGRLSAQKPDVAAYAHFVSSQVLGPGSPDTGTSTACAVAAGVVAAIRTLYSPAVLTPEQLRVLIRSSALDRGAPGFDHDYGWGIIDVPALLARLPARGSTAPPPAPPLPGRHLKSPPTMVGPDVAMWQQRMTELGFPLVVDGKYGPKSKAACKAIQQQKGLVVDGIVGPKTWAATWSAEPVPSSPVPVPPAG